MGAQPRMTCHQGPLMYAIDAGGVLVIARHVQWRPAMDRFVLVEGRGQPRSNWIFRQARFSVSASATRDRDGSRADPPQISLFY
jgi:hypothetical protein